MLVFLCQDITVLGHFCGELWILDLLSFHNYCFFVSDFVDYFRRKVFALL